MTRQVVRAALVSCALVGVWAITTVVGAHDGNNDPNAVHACVNNNSKVVRIVGVSGSCTASETSMHWAIQGPAGTNGTNGTNGTSVTVSGILQVGDVHCT